MAANPHLARLRKVCLSLPGAHEKEAWGAPTFRVNNKLFAHYRNNHHGDGRIAAWCKALPEQQMDLVDSDSERFFVPPYVGSRRPSASSARGIQCEVQQFGVSFVHS